MDDLPQAAKKTLFIFYNPNAGSEKNDSFQKAVDQWTAENSWTVEVHTTAADEDFKETLHQRTLSGEPDIVAAAGGDGTVSLVISALASLDLNIPLLIIPYGSGNLFAKNFYIPQDVHKALDLLVKDSEIGFVDLMLVNGEYRMLNAGVGFNSRLIENTTREQKRRFGIRAYLHNVWQTIRRMPQLEFTLKIDGEMQKIRGADVFIANAGFGLHSFIEETMLNPNDGVISVFVTRPSSFAGLFHILGNILKGRKRGTDVICHYKFTNELEIETDRPVLIQTDGEIIGSPPLKIRLVPSALRLIIPMHNSLLVGFETINKYFTDLINPDSKTDSKTE